MVTTRRSSFGVQDGDTLALRSKSVSVSAETTPTRKRKEHALERRSSSRKKPKPSGLDGTDDAPVVAENPDSRSLEGGKPMDEPTSKPDADVAIAQADGRNGQAKESTSWLAKDFVPLSSEPALEGAGAGAEKENDFSNTVVHTELPGDQHTDGLNPDANNEIKASDSETNPSADQDLLHPPQEADKTAAHQPSTQTPLPKVQHKRFTSEEPEPIEEESAANGPQDADLSPGVPNRTTTNDNDNDNGNDVSDDDAPEAIGSKSAVKAGGGPRLKAAKKTKRKPKSHKAAKQKPDGNIVASEPAAPGEELLVLDPPPENLNVSTNPPPEPPLLHAVHAPEPSSTQPQTTAASYPPSRSRKRKLFNINQTDERSKDVVKGGVTYRTLPNEEPALRASKTHRAAHLPPKSSASNWRLKKQVLGRKKVQHVCGGRSAFLRT